MSGLRLKSGCKILLIFHSCIDYICYAVALLRYGVGLSESKLMVWGPFLRVEVLFFIFFIFIYFFILFYFIFFSVSFSSTFEIIGSKLLGW